MGGSTLQACQDAYSALCGQVAGSAADMALPEKTWMLTDGEALANLAIGFSNG